MTMTWYEGNCGTGLSLYSQYRDVPAPVKSVDQTSAVKGDVITWTISQKIGTFYRDMFSVYSGFRFADTVPEGVRYQSARAVSYTHLDVYKRQDENQPF